MPQIIAGAVPDQALPWAISWEAVLMLADSEKLALTAYLCLAGVPTNGWGETDGVYIGMPDWTKAQADQKFCDSIAHYAASIDDMCLVPLNANQIGGLVNLAYNIGLEGLKGSTVMKQLNLKNFDAAARAFALWNEYTDPKTKKKMVSTDLTARRAREKALFMKPMPQDATQPSMPQKVDGETSLAKSPISVGGAVTAGTGAVTLLSSVGDNADKATTAVTQVSTAAHGLKGVLAQFDLSVTDVAGAFVLVAGAVILYYRLQQRRMGWA